MDLSDDLPPPRRPLFFPVVIATIFLTIIGMSAGLVLSSRHTTPTPVGQSDPTVPNPIAPTPSAITSSASPPAKPRPSLSATSTDGGTTYCRPETQKVAAEKFSVVGRLRVVLFLQTKTSAVWICLADDGQMFYHANKNSPDGPWQEGKTALFLTNVVRGEDDYHTVAADGTAFSVNKVRLLITHKDGQVENQPAVTR